MFHEMENGTGHNNHNNHNKPRNRKKRGNKSKSKSSKDKDKTNENGGSPSKKSKGRNLLYDDVVAAQLKDGLEEDMGLPIHILATIKDELIKEDPHDFQLFSN